MHQGTDVIDAGNGKDAIPAQRISCIAPSDLEVAYRFARLQESTALLMARYGQEKS